MLNGILIINIMRRGLRELVVPKMFFSCTDISDVGGFRPTLMHTKNLYENGPNPFFFFGTKNMSEGHLMHTVLVCYIFDKLGQACLCG